MGRNDANWNPSPIDPARSPRWPAARASCWRAPKAKTTRGWPTDCAPRPRRSASGERGLCGSASRACMMSRGPAPRSITDDEIEQVVVRTLESTPRGATHWSTRGMAKAIGLSHATISRIWHAFGLQPHRSETFKLSPDPLLVPKERDIVGLYVNPPKHAVVPCVDEKSQIQ